MKVEILGANTPPEWNQRAMHRDWWEDPQNAVRGESLHQAELDQLARTSRFVNVQLVREYDNPVDPLACKALVQGVHVGYLAKEVAQFLVPWLDAARLTEWWVCGEIVGGPDEGLENYGLHLWLARRLSTGPDWPFWHCAWGNAPPERAGTLQEGALGEALVHTPPRSR